MLNFWPGALLNMERPSVITVDIPISVDLISSLPHATKYICVINDKFLSNKLSIGFKYCFISGSISMISSKNKGILIPSMFLFIRSFLLKYFF